MDAESSLAEKVEVAPNNGSSVGEPADPVALKEKVADDLKSAATLKGGGDGPTLDVPLEKDDLLERLDKIDTSATDGTSKAGANNSVANDVDMENDDLIQRLEAMEKGEEEEEKVTTATSTAVNEELKDVTTDASHQNGLEESPKAAESLLEKEDEPKNEEQPTKKDVELEKKEQPANKDDELKNEEQPTKKDVELEKTEQPTNKDDELKNEEQPTKTDVELEKEELPTNKNDELKNEGQPTKKDDELEDEGQPTKKDDELEREDQLTNKDNELEKEEQLMQKDNEVEDMDVDSEEKKDDVTSSVSTAASESTLNGESSFGTEEHPTSSVKRRHSEDEEMENPEPSSKKLHVEETDDSFTEKLTSDEITQTEVKIDEQKQSEPINELEIKDNPPVAEKEESSTIDDAKIENVPENNEMEVEPSNSDFVPNNESKEASVEENFPSEDSAPPPEPDPSPEPSSTSEKLDVTAKIEPEKDKPETDGKITTMEVDNKTAETPQAGKEKQVEPEEDDNSTKVIESSNTETEAVVRSQKQPEEKSTLVEEEPQPDKKPTLVEEVPQPEDNTTIVNKKSEPEENTTLDDKKPEPEKRTNHVSEAEQAEQNTNSELDGKSEEIATGEHPETPQKEDNEEHGKPIVQTETVSEESIVETEDKTTESLTSTNDQKVENITEENIVDSKDIIVSDIAIDSSDSKEKEPAKNDDSVVETKATADEQQAESSSQGDVENVREPPNTDVTKQAEKIESEFVNQDPEIINDEESSLDSKTEKSTTMEVDEVNSPTSEPNNDNAPKSMQDDDAKPAPSTDEVEPNTESLPDTDPNTESESQMKDLPPNSSSVSTPKADEGISSSTESKDEKVDASSTIETTVSEEKQEEKVSEGETVTSSDEKPPVTPGTTPEIDSMQESNTHSRTTDDTVEEAMEVDSESIEVAEASCTKQVAYVCTDEPKDQTSTKNEAQQSEALIVEESPPAPVVEEHAEKMEVDSAGPTQSKSGVDAIATASTAPVESEQSESSVNVANIADSQSESTASAHNKNLDATEGPADEANQISLSKTLDDSIECSLPTSSSDKLADRLKQRLDMMSNGSSTPHATVSSSNVFNSTPIQKQFEISSENVSKITRNSVDNSRQDEEEHSAIVNDNSIVDDKEGAVASTSGTAVTPKEIHSDAIETSEKSSSAVVKSENSTKSETETSEVDSCTASSGFNTADEINLYTNNARKFNGISSTSGSELEVKSKIIPSSITSTAASAIVVDKLDLTPALTAEEALYEVSVWFDGSDLQFLSVERTEHKLPDATSLNTPKMPASHQDMIAGVDTPNKSSSGSVSSIGPFSLPLAKPTTDSALSHSSTSSSGTTSQMKTQLPRMKQTVRGAKALASLMIEEFTKIKRALCKDDELHDLEPVESTPRKASKSRPAASSTKKGTSGRGQKRTHTDSETTEGDEPKPKAKQAKKNIKSAVEPTTPTTSTPRVAESESTPDLAKQHEEAYCCLARWTDRKYYAGKITGYKGDNKFMVLFEDGASKALSKDVIVFGEKDTLPIIGHSVHALTGGDTYEPGFVTEIKRNEANEVIYVVQIGDGSIEVTASDMYLNDEQAKAINRACKATQDVADERNSSMHSPQSSGRWGGSASNTPVIQTPDEKITTSAEKGSRSTRSKRGADKPQTPVTPEAGYSGGVGKKGRRGRRLS
ncbi:titin homolog isoform X2 [Toxorhynchites rutilus septentrionalis]|uniref:titin homolog isoform X2 n=1 Tax=Toxorhynchites rutilus septentrionalis TaxID=329112 RepID=UPI0024783BBC|nr:titin homolog isoform X2 [Toxorhynchites rutilus septentrionalis]